MGCVGSKYNIKRGYHMRKCALSAVKAHTCDIVRNKAGAFNADLFLRSSDEYHNIPLKSNDDRTRSNEKVMMIVRGLPANLMMAVSCSSACACELSRHGQALGL